MIEKLRFHYTEATPKEMMDNKALWESIISQRTEQLQDKINEIIDHLSQEKDMCKEGYGEHDYCVMNTKTGKTTCCNCGKVEPTKEVPLKWKIRAIFDEFVEVGDSKLKMMYTSEMADKYTDKIIQEISAHGEEIYKRR